MKVSKEGELLLLGRGIITATEKMNVTNDADQQTSTNIIVTIFSSYRFSFAFFHSLFFFLSLFLFLSLPKTGSLGI